jgi:HlyD family secretion protein
MVVGTGVVVVACGCGGGEGASRPSGTLEATEVSVSPLLQGRVLEVRADEGARVEAGDTLIVLDTEPIALERLQALARLDALLAQRGEAQEALRQSEQLFAFAETTFARTEALAAQGSASRQQNDDAATQRDLAQSRVRAARAHLLAVDAQRAEVEAALAVLDRRLADGIVLAPRGGTVLLRSVEPGEVVASGSAALRIADLDRLELRVFLEADELDRVRLGERVAVYVDALEGRELAGTVTWVSEEAEFTPKNVQTRAARAQLVYAVKIQVDNPEGRLHVGMPAEIALPEPR